MAKYICSQCTGRSGEEHTFHLSQTPKACPYNGCPERYIKSIEEYLREQLSDAEWGADHWEEKYDEMKAEKQALEEEIETLKTDTDQ